MHFPSFSALLQMGGYAFYVWLAYGITLAAMLCLILSTFFTKKKIYREIQKKRSREQRMKKAQKMENTL